MNEPIASPLIRRDAVTLSDASDVLIGESRKKGLARLWLFLGPAFIASIAYVDSGNFATNMPPISREGPSPNNS